MTCTASPLQQILAARAEIADRVEEAFDTLGRLPDDTKAKLGVQSQAWPTVVRRMWEDAPAGTVVRRPPPPAAQITRMHEVLVWMVELGKANRKWADAVYLVCGRRWNVSRAAKVLGCDRKTARVWARNGLDYVALHRAKALTP